MEKSDEKKEFAQPTNEDYLSYYVYQGEWKPTKPLRPIGAMSSSPGPAIVALPTTIGEDKHDFTLPKAPAFKIGHRILTESEKSKTGPGPGAYDISDVTNKGKENSRAPKIGKADRFREREAIVSSSPGPAAYDRQIGDRYIYNRGPAYSMSHGGRRGKTRAASTPAPNAYNLPPVLGPGKSPLPVGPSYTLGKDKRMREAVKFVQNPGPAAYVLPSHSANFKKAPSFSMGSKAAPPTGGTYGPGPAAHSAHKVKFDKYSTPRITFGIRHSPYKVIPGFSAEK